MSSAPSGGPKIWGGSDPFANWPTPADEQAPEDVMHELKSNLGLSSWESMFDNFNRIRVAAATPSREPTPESSDAPPCAVTRVDGGVPEVRIQHEDLVDDLGTRRTGPPPRASRCLPVSAEQTPPCDVQTLESLVAAYKCRKRDEMSYPNDRSVDSRRPEALPVLDRIRSDLQLVQIRLQKHSLPPSSFRNLRPAFPKGGN
ncbi:Uncharacterized protein PBTT_00402 [Plasmodiophora brassicae]